MMRTSRVFYKIGMMAVGDRRTTYCVSRVIDVVFYEKTETWGCPDLFGRQFRVSWNDLRKKVMRTLCEEARTAARKAYLAQLPRDERHIDMTPKSATEVFG
jgi:hypothetical protein